MSEAVITALIAVIPSLLAAITAIVTTLVASGKKKKEEFDKQVDKIKEEIKEDVGKKFDDMGKKVDNMGGALDTLQKDVTNVSECLQNHIDNDNVSTRVLLRHNIDQMYDKFMPRGYITLKESEEITETYEAYKAIGGNHIGEEKYFALMDLPRRD